MRYKKTLIVGAILSVGIFISYQLDFTRPDVIWGVTFSETYTKALKLPWQETYKAILNEIDFKKIRLVAYWNEIETKKGSFDFSDLDWQIDEATKAHKDITLTVGYRVPRWPECYAPDWTKDYSDSDFENSINAFVKKTVERYKEKPAIKSWQIENEPFLGLFGDCKKITHEALKKRIEMVKEIDSTRSIITTDTGELSFWTRMRGLSDTFGSTLYKIVWNEYIGHFHHFFPASFYTARFWLLNKLSPSTSKFIISELQSEPWPEDSLWLGDMPFERQIKHFDTEDMRNIATFAKKTGAEEIYLWGAEWWYFRKVHGDDAFWEEAKKIVK